MCEINSQRLSPCPIKCGVPKGSILGSILFLLYFNEFENCLKCSKVLSDINRSKEEKVILQAITQSCSCNALINWQKVFDDLPKNNYVFIRKKVDSTFCALYKTNNQTQLYMLNCPATVRSGRYTWRHNSILCHYLSEFENARFNFTLISLVSKILLNYSID